MKHRHSWLRQATRAHEALTHHQTQLTQQARLDSEQAQQHAFEAHEATSALARTWLARREGARVDPGIDQAYADFHQHLVQEAVRRDDTEAEAKQALATAMAELTQAHGTAKVLNELQQRQAVEAATHQRKAELHSQTELWLLGRLASKDASE